MFKKNKLQKFIYITLVIIFFIMLSAVIGINVLRAIDANYRKELLKNYKKNLNNKSVSVSNLRRSKSYDVLHDFLYDDKKYKGQSVVGELKINKINLDYPILDNDKENTLMISVGLTAGNVNAKGNCVIAGHNMKNKTLFGNLDKLTIGDYITLINERGSVSYKIFKRTVVNPMDFSILSQDTGGKKWVTVFTCTNGGKQRLAFQAEEVNKEVT